MDAVPLAFAVDFGDQAVEMVGSGNQAMRIGDPLQDVQARFQFFG
jgi:hypothetical protein